MTEQLYGQLYGVSGARLRELREDAATLAKARELASRLAHREGNDVVLVDAGLAKWPDLLRLLGVLTEGADDGK